MINFIHNYWPELINRHPGFLKEFITPIIKVSRGAEKQPFFTIPEYEKWASKQTNIKSFKIKYYKGLGTSTSLEAKEYFKNIVAHRIKFNYRDDQDDDAIDLAFNKKRADHRKEWL